MKMKKIVPRRREGARQKFVYVDPPLTAIYSILEHNHSDLIGVKWMGQKEVLYFGSIRMNILMLDTRNVEQTKDVHMYT